MPVISTFESVPWSFNALAWDKHKAASCFGFGNCRRYQNIYVPIHRDPAVVGATEVIKRPDIAVDVPLAGDTGAAQGQEDKKDDATIERIIDLPIPSKVGPAEKQEGKGTVNEALVQSIATKDLKERVVGENSTQHKSTSGKRTTASESSYAKGKKRRLEQRDNDFALR